MSVSSFAAALDRRNIHYGWVIVGATLLVTVVTAAAMSTPGVLIVPLEQRCKRPVVSSTPHALWASVRLLGLSGQAKGYGTLLARG